MDSDGGSQVVLDTYTRTSPPFSAHQFFPGGRVRDSMNVGRQASFSPRVCLDSTCANPQAMGSIEHGQYGHQYNRQRMEWDMNWDWDSVLFLAQPTAQVVQASERPRYHRSEENGSGSKHHSTNTDSVDLRLDGLSASPEQNGSSDPDDIYISERRRKSHLGLQENGYATQSDRTQPFLRDGSSPEEDAESLSLKLGGHSYAFSDDAGNGSRNAKRYRSSSPVPQFPMCQVDDCKADLSHAKDYHRRHKVCEVHAKAVKALVSRLMQRFCQQCSRFHPLTEFDEGKRSCRRRLAGHNRRRRKNQPDPVAGRAYGNGEENGTGKAAGLLGFLNILSQLQAANSVGALNGVTNDQNALLKLLKRGSTSPSCLDNLSAAALANLLKRHGVSLENGRPDLKPQSSPPNDPALAEREALLSALAAPATTEALSLLLQTSIREQLTSAIMKVAESPLSHIGHSSGTSSLPTSSPGARIPDKEVERSHRPPFPLSSPMAARPLGVNNLASSSRSNSIRQQIVVENAVHRGDQLQTDSLPGQVSSDAVVQRLFPLTQTSEYKSNGNGKLDVNRGDDGATESNSEDVEVPASVMTFLESQDPRMLQEVVSHHHSRPFIDLQQPPPQSMNESSPSGSDQSPSSSSDWQDRTGRITFKLFDKDPGDLPLVLRKQIFDWLAHRPSDMESYIRPGCVVLSIFLSMPKSAWEELERNMQTSLQKLTSSGEFWRKGRIHVQLERRNALIVDGRIHINKCTSPPNAAQILSVRPFAVVAGQRTAITLRGSNIKLSGTRIFCAYQGKYVDGLQLVDEQQGLEGPVLDSPPEHLADQEECKIAFWGGLPSVVGRCFVEVERTSGGHALPVIVADKLVCAELQTLENEIETQCLVAAEEAKRSGLQPEEISHQTHVMRVIAEMEVRNFLNELGWLFQKSQVLSPLTDVPKLSPSRQKRLLIYAVERDWCAVVNKVLDIIFGLVLGASEQILTGLVEIFEDETSLLHRAVKRNCRAMVELLVAYVPYSGADTGNMGAKKFLEGISKHGSQHRSIFTPDMPGPEGFTPLHIAASMKGAEGVIDALTNDPNHIGLHTWLNVKNSMGESPCSCAIANQQFSYVRLVTIKLGRREGQVSITIPAGPGTGVMDGTKHAANISSPVDLPLWSNRASLRVENGVAARLVNPHSCRPIRSSLNGYRGSMYRPFMLSMVAIAAVCVCVCVVMKTPPMLKDILPRFSWHRVKYGFQ